MTRNENFFIALALVKNQEHTCRVSRNRESLLTTENCVNILVKIKFLGAIISLSLMTKTELGAIKTSGSN